MARNFRSRKIIFFGIAAALWSSYAAGASINDVSPQMRHDAECMTNVLKTQVSGIDNIKIDVWNDGHWLHPYVQYRAAADKSGFRYVVQFIAYPKCSPNPKESCCSDTGRDYCFSAVLPGIVGPGERLSDWGTSKVQKKWKDVCGINADAVYD